MEADGRTISHSEASASRVIASTPRPMCRRRPGTQATEIEATLKRAARQQIGSVRSGIQSGSFTLAQALLLHINDQPGSTPLHLANLKLYAREILTFFDPATPVVFIDAVRIQDYQKFAAKQTNKVWRGGTLKTRSRTDAKWWKDTGKVRSVASTNHYLGCLRGALLAAHKTRHPVTGQPMLPFPPIVASLPKGKRRPRPMPDGELNARLAVAPQWTRDAAELARLFGLRRAEARSLERRHIDRERHCLRWPEDETKSGHDEDAYGGVEGWALLVRLDAVAKVRDQDHLVTWPGLTAPAADELYAAGKRAEQRAGAPLKSAGSGHGRPRRRRPGSINPTGSTTCEPATSPRSPRAARQRSPKPRPAMPIRRLPPGYVNIAAGEISATTL